MEAIWNLPIFDALHHVDTSSMWNWFVDVQKLLGTDEFLVAMVLAWKAWDRRNKEIKREEALHVNEMVSWCKVYLASFKSAQLQPNSQMQTVHPSEWIPPSHGRVKVNFDAALPRGQQWISVSAVARNEVGRCIGWKVVKIRGNFQPVERKALAALKAISMAKDRGWSDIVIEGDCLPIIKALREGENEAADFGAVVEDCRQMALEFQYCSFNFTKRSGNKLAHAIAQIPCNNVVEDLVLPPNLAYIA
ncbi:PREDICTED: uncharacterized protein LOC105971241 [Erythranthe guttata]|uniref:uncharacterized protein LOC105971241 n=1 Tax=Erythranthe guttata TaxID=4155 RepID=UPI00064DA65E|nr:PREDICTED: uncharacterized protein LOC105971241 [Erythranthe guttata]|eukprot:XP_012851546.1 PREDICTED: uncharacterized protein LOC105971241 [Erythranthe guttata]